MILNKLRLLITSLCLLSTPIWAVDNVRITSVKGMGLGFQGVTQSITFNPALVSWANKLQLETQFNNRYAIQELSTYALNLSLPNRFIDVALSAATFGSSIYRESTFGLMIGKQLMDNISLGGAIYYSHSNMLDNQYNQVSVDLGITYLLNERFKLALACLNLSQGYDIRTGFIWNIHSQVTFAGEISYAESAAFAGSVGIEYQPIPAFSVRSGIITHAMQPTFGLGYTFSSFTLDGALSYHHALGVSSAIGLKVIF